MIWETEPLINNAVMVRDDVPPAVREQGTSALLALAQTPAGPAILSGMAMADFHAAEDASYGVAADYIRRFERVVRPVDTP